MNQNDKHSSQNILHKVLLKENETLKRITKDKLEAKDTFSALIEVLEMQRARIAELEEGKLFTL